MCRQDFATVFSSVFYLFCGLSRKVRSYFDHLFQQLRETWKFRILIACIKYLANCPCPQCLVKKAEIPALGTKYDMRRWQQKSIRIDDHPRRHTVELARKWIYEDGTPIGSTYMGRLLGPKSLTPTRVCHTYMMLSCAETWARMHSQHALDHMALIFTQ